MWIPQEVPLKMILIKIHGMHGRISAERGLVDLINPKGIGLVGCDHIGHGLSDGFPISCTIEEIIEETTKVIQLVREKFPDVPLFITGHSLGGLSLIKMLIDSPSLVRNYKINGVILECPWISDTPSRPISMMETIFLPFLSKYFPFMKIPIPDIILAEDVPLPFREWLQTINKDFNYVTPKIMYSSLKAMTIIRSNAHKWPDPLPLLFLQGGSDNIVNPETNLDWANLIKETYKLTTNTYTDTHREDLIQIKQYEHCSHDVIKSQYRSLALTDLFNFMSEHSKIQIPF